MYLSDIIQKNAIVFIFIAALCALGCARTINFSVVRAAKINIPDMASKKGVPPTVSVDNWTAENPAWSSEAAEIAQYLREAITNSPGGIVKFAETGGVVVLSGNLMEHSAEERETEEEKTCTDQQKRKYACIDYKRIGTARLRVAMNVTDDAGQTIASETVPLEDEESTNHFFVPKADVLSGTTSPGAPPIDWEPIFLKMRELAAEKLAQLVVPYPVTVTKPWFKCGDANDLCEAGVIQLQNSNFEEAKSLFDQAKSNLEAASDKDSKALSAVYWALTLINEFSGNFVEARKALKEAIKYQPTESVYAAEMKAIDAEEQNAAKLSSQGVAGGK
jgi:tetratricopeptide (TPR) repeat protein